MGRVRPRREGLQHLQALRYPRSDNAPSQPQRYKLRPADAARVAHRAVWRRTGFRGHHHEKSPANAQEVSASAIAAARGVGIGVRSITRSLLSAQVFLSDHAATRDARKRTGICLIPAREFDRSRATLPTSSTRLIRGISASNISRNSSRARYAPAQKCSPLLNARCSLGDRLRLKVKGFSKTVVKDFKIVVEGRDERSEIAFRRRRNDLVECCSNLFLCRHPACSVLKNHR